MFKFESDEVRDLQRELEQIGKRSIPFATRAALNGAAFRARALSRENIQDSMTLRNKWTLGSVRVEPDRRELNIRRQAAVIGSTEGYLEDQEFGTTEAARGSEGVAIPTGYSAGQNGQKPRTRLPRRPNQLKNIKLSKRRRAAKNKAQENLFKIQDAVTSGRRVVYLDFGKTKGLFKVVGGRKSFKRGGPKGARLQMLYDLSRPAVRIPARPWLAPATDRAAAELPKLYGEALAFQLKRRRKYR